MNDRSIAWSDLCCYDPTVLDHNCDENDGLFDHVPPSVPALNRPGARLVTGLRNSSAVDHA